MRLLSFILTGIIFFQHLTAQELKYIIRFKDKKDNGFSLSDPGRFLTEQSIQRRLRQNIPIDSTDLPLTSSYVDSLSAVANLRVLNKSRWLNECLIAVTDTSILQRILQFPFVLSTEPVNNRQDKKFNGRVPISLQAMTSSKMAITQIVQTNISLSDYYNYGASQRQVTLHHGEYLHNRGFHGEGMTIALLDDGFNSYLSNPAFDSIRNDQRVLGTYDFVHLKTSVNEEDMHGANCFSIIASNIPGILVGTAPAARYWLFKTEDITSETPVEEQNWIAAAEFADSVGADLISTSLGYDYFDDPTYNLNYPQRNGHSSPISIAANFAVAKGMIVTASQGNDGEQSGEKKYVLCPADGDSVFAVGAVDANAMIAAFSSWGPNASGQVKPDAVSMGLGTAFVAASGSLHTGNGTSYSNPNLAGLIACLWQAFPSFSAQDILAAVRQSSDRFTSPDNHYGFGLPDFEKAYQWLLIKEYPGLVQSAKNENVFVFPVPFQQTIHIFLKPTVSGEASIGLLNVSGKIIQTIKIPVTAGQPQIYIFNVPQVLSTGEYFIRYADAQYTKTIKVLKN